MDKNDALMKQVALLMKAAEYVEGTEVIVCIGFIHQKEHVPLVYLCSGDMSVGQYGSIALTMIRELSNRFTGNTDSTPPEDPNNFI